MTPQSKAVAFILSAVLVIIIIGSLAVLDEFDSGLKAFLNILTGHHLVTKSVFIAILLPLFSLVFYSAFKSPKTRETLHADSLWTWSLILIAVTIVFYLLTLMTYTLNYLI